jgi:hypothetical protein
MIEDALREGSSGGSGSESLGETEGLSYGQVSLHVDERSSGDWLLGDDDTSSLGKGLIDTTDDIIRSLDLTKENWLLEFRHSSELTSVHDSSSGRHNLTSTSMDSISMEGDIMDVESDTSHVLFAHGTFFGSPLEGRVDGVLDLIEELSTLGNINKNVGSVSVGTETPNLLGFILGPIEIVDEDLGSFFGIDLGADFLFFNHEGEFITKRLTLAEKSIMLVGGFREAHLR